MLVLNSLSAYRLYDSDHDLCGSPWSARICVLSAESASDCQDSMRFAV